MHSLRSTRSCCVRSRDREQQKASGRLGLVVVFVLAMSISLHPPRQTEKLVIVHVFQGADPLASHVPCHEHAKHLVWYLDLFAFQLAVLALLDVDAACPAPGEQLPSWRG